ncbi:hypothetical protein DPEC_G00059150 [Dallia pectoralis]|uniref:Uncharacterized protein n=1 Tax=Dallia pectoralis TaxID=75939 RepID=A0ACC2H6M9_DALPE|nr:hypothetical protein DPEC_G00059150 [Dallia pectoralis]
MSTCIGRLQTQLTSILDVLAKTAVADIAKLIDDNCAVLHFEISRSQNENEMLRRKLQLMENEFKISRIPRQTEKYLHSCASDWRTSHRGADAFGAKDLTLGLALADAKFAEVDLPFIKVERPDEGQWSRAQHGGPSGQGNPTFVNDAVQKLPVEMHQQLEEEESQAPITLLEEQLAEDPETLCKLRQSASRGDEETSVLEFVIKTEKDEEHSIFSQDGCQQRNTVKQQNPQSSEFVMDERDSQLWSSIVQGNDTDIVIDTDFPDFSCVADQYSESFSDCSKAPPVSTQVDEARKADIAPSQRPCGRTVFNKVFQKEKATACQTGSGFQCLPHVTHPQQQVASGASICLIITLRTIGEPP